MQLPAKIEEVSIRKSIQIENDTKLKYFGLYKWDILKAKVINHKLNMLFREKNFMMS